MAGLTPVHSIEEVADELSLSAKTVSTFRSRVLEKLGLQDNADLARCAAERGLIEGTSFQPDYRSLARETRDRTPKTRKGQAIAAGAVWFINPRPGRFLRAVRAPEVQERFTGSMSTVRVMSSGSATVSTSFARWRLSAGICRVRSMSW